MGFGFFLLCTISAVIVLVIYLPTLEAVPSKGRRKQIVRDGQADHQCGEWGDHQLTPGLRAAWCELVMALDLLKQLWAAEAPET